MITKGERTELRQVVRNQFKVLRSEILQRQSELAVAIDDEIANKFSEEDANWAACQHAIHECVMAANRAINDALRDHGYEKRGPTERLWLDTPSMRKPESERRELRGSAVTQVAAQVRTAQLRLDRQEADLLRTLAIGALESEEARAFLSAIPTVGELVPGARLAELEAHLSEDDA